MRLLQPVGEVGGDTAHDPVRDNLLIRGDALHVLTSLVALPEYAAEYRGRVSLAYLDPPFNTGNAFVHYADALEHSVWLTMIRDRLRLIRELLAPDGSVWVHLDDTEVHRCRAVLDELFGAENFVATVVWEKADSPRMDAQWFSTRHDFLLVYGKTPDVVVNGFDYRPDEAAHYNRVDAQGRRYYLKPLRAMGGQGSTRAARPTLSYPLTAPDGTEVWPKLRDGTDGAWRWRPDKVEQDAHLIEWVQGDRGWQPYFRIYGETVARRPPETIWSAADVGSNRTSKREIQRLFPEIAAFDTPKPEALMARVIQIATNKGDIVLDPFAGSGTTAAVAHKMGRRWVTSELVGETIDRFTLPRLVKVARGEDPGGVTEVLEWEGGGGFSILDVAPSMFELDEDAVVLAPWATGGALAEATAAQLGFGYELRGPFCGRRGRTRLAVIDGLVNRAVIELLLEQLAHDENLVVCGTGVDDEARALLATTRPSATVSLIPAAILSTYGRPRRWRPNVPTRTEPVETDGQVAEPAGEEVTA